MSVPIHIETYRVGWWTHHWWPRAKMLKLIVTGAQPDSRHVGRMPFVRTAVRNLRLIRRPHRPWQAEVEGVRFCRRAFTPNGARRKMLRDAEVAYGVVTGYHLASPWQLRCEARANAKEIRLARASGPMADAEVADA